MSDTVVSIRNLSKCYVIGHRANRHDGLRHLLEQRVRAPLQWLRGRKDARKASREEFWALRDVEFDIRRGETIGIIGRNGAGKSTLLKILSRITEPTTGSVRLRGRVASLLEVGTGFHPDLTGRENVFLNGAILGMTRAEIRRKFDEIVEFSGVEKFLDTPVKRFSSGMYVRLAFAVAAHLEPEILLVDEVLAVGDARFQKKCLDKMDDVGKSGRTVFFVSHNIQAVTRLCQRCVLFEDGRVKMDGAAGTVANAYMSAGLETPAVRRWPDPDSAPGDGVVRLRAVRVRSEAGPAPDAFDIREPVGIELEYDLLQPGRVLLPHFGLINEEGLDLFVSCDLDPKWRGRKRPAGRYRGTGWIPGNLLAEGSFTVRVMMLSLDPDELHFMERDAVMFRVVDDLSAKDTARGDYGKPMPGLVRPVLRWVTEHEPAAADSAAPEPVAPV